MFYWSWNFETLFVKWIPKNTIFIPWLYWLKVYQFFFYIHHNYGKRRAYLFLKFGAKKHLLNISNIGPLYNVHCTFFLSFFRNSIPHLTFILKICYMYSWPNDYLYHIFLSLCSLQNRKETKRQRRKWSLRRNSYYRLKSNSY